MPNGLVELFKHNTWANLKILEACEKFADEQLDAGFPGNYGTIRDTLVHIFGAEERYVDRLTGRPKSPSREREGFKSFDLLREICTSNGEILVGLMARNDLPDVVAGKTPAGEPSELDTTVLIVQAINHGTEHRAHINSILTQLGVEPIEIDAWAYAGAHNMIRVVNT